MKKNIYIKIIIPIVCLLSIAVVYANKNYIFSDSVQNISVNSTTSDDEINALAGKDLANINAAYDTKNTFKSKIVYQLLDKEMKNAVEELTGVFTQYKKDYHLQMGPYEFLKIEDKLLRIDHEDKKAILYNDAKPFIDANDFASFTELLNETGVIGEVEKINEQEHSLFLELPEGGSSHNIQLWYNTGDFLIKKMEMEVNDPFEGDETMVLRVLYNDTQVEKSKFPYSMKSYIKTKKKQISLSDSFKGYTLEVID